MTSMSTSYSGATTTTKPTVRITVRLDIAALAASAIMLLSVAGLAGGLSRREQ